MLCFHYRFDYYLHSSFIINHCSIINIIILTQVMFALLPHYVMCSLLISLGLGKFLHDSEIQETRDYVENIDPMLDKYKREHGRYPESLSVFPDSEVPQLLREPHGYTGNINGFRFEYRDRAGMMDGFCFDSSTREWYYFD